MKVAILGTRGIPNHYGGFEQLAENLSVSLAERGHQVSVYNSSLHPYQGGTYKGVNLIHCFDPEDKMGTFGQFIYDLNCIRDSRSRDFDVILQLGYTSNSVWSFLLPEKARIITNMDGFEWKRSKYAGPVKQFLKYAEQLAVQSSGELIADSVCIQAYLRKKYERDSAFISYGAYPFYKPDRSMPGLHGLEPHGYYLAIARFEPENNLETIIRGYLKAEVKEPLVLIGSTLNKFGKHLRAVYNDNRIRYFETIYDIGPLNNLRYFSKLYFHGHSVGGTNPSLIEAMASQALICAHDNNFNRAVLGDDAFYFASDKQVAERIRESNDELLTKQMVANNLGKVENHYTWKNVVDAYERMMLKSLGK